MIRISLGAAGVFLVMQILVSAAVTPAQVLLDKYLPLQRPSPDIPVRQVSADVRSSSRAMPVARLTHPAAHPVTPRI